MDVSFSYFLDAMSASPVLLITVLLTLGVIFVNGWTDAPNAIATCIT
ncbi:MAG: inorganic phosphate transporter, partial [Acutalibacter sp.]